MLYVHPILSYILNMACCILLAGFQIDVGPKPLEEET